jgi:hypothetical protein
MRQENISFLEELSVVQAKLILLKGLIDNLDISERPNLSLRVNLSSPKKEEALKEKALKEEAKKLGIPVNTDHPSFDLNDLVLMVQKANQYNYTLNHDQKHFINWSNKEWRNLDEIIEEYEVLIERADLLGIDNVTSDYTPNDLIQLRQIIDDKVEEGLKCDRLNRLLFLQDKFN